MRLLAVANVCGVIAGAKQLQRGKRKRLNSNEKNNSVQFMLSILFFTKFSSKQVGNFMEGFVVNFLSKYKQYSW